MLKVIKLFLSGQHSTSTSSCPVPVYLGNGGNGYDRNFSTASAFFSVQETCVCCSVLLQGSIYAKGAFCPWLLRYCGSRLLSLIGCGLWNIAIFLHQLFSLPAYL